MSPVAVGRLPQSRPRAALVLASSPPRRALRLWAPATPLALLFAPFALAAIPLLEIFLRRRGWRPARAVLALGGALLALSGTLIDIDAPGFRLRLRIF
ncbi:MAG: hypothetical protein ACRED9_06445 [Caulobacteraceae bacterium]